MIRISFSLATTSLGDPDLASGIYRSTNGGENWIRMGAGLPTISSQGATDVCTEL